MNFLSVRTHHNLWNEDVKLWETTFLLPTLQQIPEMGWMSVYPGIPGLPVQVPVFICRFLSAQFKQIPAETTLGTTGFADIAGICW